MFQAITQDRVNCIARSLANCISKFHTNSVTKVRAICITLSCATHVVTPRHSHL
jgi:coenzyme F420-reducing hydrogenase alpha subunit